MTSAIFCAWRRLDCHGAAFPVVGSLESLPRQWRTRVLGRATQLSYMECLQETSVLSQGDRSDAYMS